MKVNVIFAAFVLGVCLAQDDTTIKTTTDKPTTATPQTTTPQTTTPTNAPNNTTTSTTTTTTTSAPTTTPAPGPASNFYTLYDGDVPCIMLSSDIRVNVQYTDDKKESKKGVVRVPVPTATNTTGTASGSCKNADNTSSLTISWGQGSSNLTLGFNLTEASKWELYQLTLYTTIDAQDFPGAPDQGKTLFVNGSLPGLSNVPVAVNSSLTCRAFVESSDFSGAVAGSNETYTVTATALGTKMEAFNTAPGKFLQEGLQCSQDDTSDLIPLSVGCALAALVLIVLISYLVGRRRRAAAYQSV